MSRWFRFYADAMRNPKVAALSDQDFRLWVELLAIASENDGHIPPLESLKHVLKRRLDHLSRGLKGLIRALLIDALTDGYTPHNWSKFQYKSDVSTDRVHKYRKKRNVSETAPETDTDTELPLANANGAIIDPEKVMFDAGVQLLATAGKSEGQARAWLGKAKRDYGSPAVISAIGAAKREGAIQPISFMEGVLRKGARAGDSAMAMPC
jgi:hypothetical protein